MKTILYNILNEVRNEVRIEDVNLDVRVYINGAIFEIFNEALVITDSMIHEIYFHL